jgi:hypothetical protein
MSRTTKSMQIVMTVSPKAIAPYWPASSSNGRLTSTSAPLRIPTPPLDSTAARTSYSTSSGSAKTKL